MDDDPIVALKRPYKAPSSALEGSSRGINIGINIARTESPYFNNSNYNASSNSYKRQKLDSRIYKDEETTGYEEDGTEASWINDGAGAGKALIVPGINVGLKNRTNSNGVHEESHRAGGSKDCYYACQWRKPQARKNKTWEEDGILVVNGDRAVLKAQETAKIVASGKLPNGGRISEGDEFSIGGRDVVVGNTLSAKVYFDGSVFGDAPPPRTEAVKPVSASTGSFYGPSKTLSSKKFVGPTLTRPSYSTSKIALPLPGRISSDLVPDENDAPSNLNGSFPKRQPFHQPNPSSRTTAATSGLGRQPAPPKSMFDPEKPGAIVMRRPDDEHMLRFNKKGLPVVDVVVDPIIGSKLRQHQKEGLQFMYESVMGMKIEGQGCILADDMGLGKTIQSIALVWTLLKQNPYFGAGSIMHRALIVCPVTLVKNWGKEFQKWLGRDRCGVFMANAKTDIRNFARNKTYHVLIIGYERLRTVVDDLKSIQPPIGLIICDEGHRLKSAGAKTTQALRAFSTSRRIILSGTPIQNELSEFHSMVDFVIPGLLDTLQLFRKTYEQPILKSREQHCSEDAKDLGGARTESLARLTRTFVLRRTSEVIAGYLPPKSEYVVFVAPTPLQIRIYNHVIGSNQLKRVINGGSSALSLITLLRKVCNTPGLLLKDAQMGKNEAVNEHLVEEVIALYPPGARPNDEGLSGKLLAVSTLLRSLKEGTEEKVVLVSNFTSTLDVLESLCQKQRFNYCRLDGKTKQQLRQEIVDNFNRTLQASQFVFLLSSKSGGTGLNIVGASRLILFDSDWNPSNDLQAMARIHRDGQKRPCVIYRILTTGTMDEKIYQRQIMKTGLAGSLMDGSASTTGGGSSSKNAFSVVELRKIFTLHLDTPCQTHDLLGCDCTPVSNAVNENLKETLPAIESEEEDDLSDFERKNFVKASQYKSPRPKEVKAQRKLAALKEWAHINCQLDDDVILDNIEDEVLREAVDSGFKRMRIADRQNRSLSVEMMQDQDEDSFTKDEQIPRSRWQGGEVTYVFHRNSAPLAAT